MWGFSSDKQLSLEALMLRCDKMTISQGRSDVLKSGQGHKLKRGQR